MIIGPSLRPPVRIEAQRGSFRSVEIQRTNRSAASRVSGARGRRLTGRVGCRRIAGLALVERAPGARANSRRPGWALVLQPRTRRCGSATRLLSPSTGRTQPATEPDADLGRAL